MKEKTDTQIIMMMMIWKKKKMNINSVFEVIYKYTGARNAYSNVLKTICWRYFMWCFFLV